MRHAFLLIILLVIVGTAANAEMYKWVDEKGTVHFTDDFSKIPEKYRPDAQSQKAPKEYLKSSPLPKKKRSRRPLQLLKRLLNQWDLRSLSK